MDVDYQVGEVELSCKSTVRKKLKIATSSDAYGMLLPTFREDTIGYKEYFKVVLLNQAQEVLGCTQISEGGITETSADVRIILQAALLTNATANSRAQSSKRKTTPQSAGYCLDGADKKSSRDYANNGHRPHYFDG